MFTRISAHSPERTDLPLFAKDVTSAIASEQAELGILICGTAAWGCPSPPTKSAASAPWFAVSPFCHALAPAQQHKCAGAWLRAIGPELARMIVKSWLEAEFEGGRHASRVEMISQMEAERLAEIPAKRIKQTMT